MLSPELKNHKIDKNEINNINVKIDMESEMVLIEVNNVSFMLGKESEIKTGYNGSKLKFQSWDELAYAIESNIKEYGGKSETTINTDWVYGNNHPLQRKPRF